MTENYSLLMENLLQVSSALTSLELMNKSGVRGVQGTSPGPATSGGLPLRAPSTAPLPVTPETSPTAGSGGGGLRDTVDIITTL